MKAILILFILLFAGSAFATSTDGNYTLLQFDVLGSGESTLVDGNYVSFTDVGESITHQSMTDNNYSAGVGFYGESIVRRVALAIVEVVAAAAATTIVIIPMLGGNSLIAMVMLIVVLGFSAILFLFRKNLRTAIDDLRNEKV